MYICIYTHVFAMCIYSTKLGSCVYRLYIPSRGCGLCIAYEPLDSILFPLISLYFH